MKCSSFLNVCVFLFSDTVDGGAVLTPGPAVLSGHTAGDLMSLMDRISSDPDLESTVRGDPGLVEDLSRVKALLGDARFQKTLLFAQKVEKSLNGAGQMNSFGQIEHTVPSPEEVTEDCINYLATMEGQEGGSFGGGPAEDTEEAMELRKTVSRSGHYPNSYSVCIFHLISPTTWHYIPGI